ncbi:hypothetical protein [Streptomyces sp. NPDC049915]|uniref:hypothetical protein n=1 Tax=Streptomyces sp. NPDC049915 TaxID=3155510 RepID=UPI003430F35F
MLRKITSALATGTLLAGLGLATSGTAHAAPAAYPKVYLHTTVTQWTHWTPDANNSSHAGTLYAGSNYFYCHVQGALYSVNGRYSREWLLTDDDSGNRKVYVSDLNLTHDDWEREYLVLGPC